MGKIDIIARIERRRKWTAEEKAALLAEVEAEGGRVAVVARRHRISDSLLYNWRSARKAAAVARRAPERAEFVPIGVLGPADGEGTAMLASPSPQPVHPCLEERAGVIEIVLPSGARLRVDADVNEKALRRVLHAMKGAV